MTLSSRTTWTVGAAVASAVLVLLGWMLLVSPRLDAATASRTAAQETAEANVGLQARAAALAADQANIAALRAELDTLHAQFPSTLELADMVRQLAHMATQSGAAVQDVSRSDPAAREDQTSVWEVPVSLTVAGTHDQILAYVDRLQGVTDRMFLVTRVALATGADGSMTGTITGYAFVLPTADPAGAESTDEGATP